MRVTRILSITLIILCQLGLLIIVATMIDAYSAMRSTITSTITTYIYLHIIFLGSFGFSLICYFDYILFKLGKQALNTLERSLTKKKELF